MLVGHGDNPRYVQQGKPVIPDPINKHFKGPSDTLSQMIAQADLVVRGRIAGERPRDGPDIAITRTGYRTQVLEIVHLSSQNSIPNPDLNEVEIVRSGGIRDRGAYIEQSYEVGFPSFDMGHEYLLFLVWNRALESWVPAYGPDSAFDLTSGVAETAGKLEPARVLNGKKAADVLELLHRSVK